MWYDAILDACCLRPDLDQLGEAGDTERERGVTLSGGQKQHDCLARVAYARSDLVVLDDPFSARYSIDSSVRRAVYFETRRYYW